jgi:hypothetical protein
VPNLLRGFQFSQKTLWPEASKLNLLKLVPALQMPVFFSLGRQDHWVPPETRVAYFEALEAPLKKLVWFDQSGHAPFVDEPTKLNAAMVEMVRPAAVFRNELAYRVDEGVWHAFTSVEIRAIKQLLDGPTETP